MDSNLGAENAVSKQSGSKTLGKFSEAFLLDSPPDPPADWQNFRSQPGYISVTTPIKEESLNVYLNHMVAMNWGDITEETPTYNDLL